MHSKADYEPHEGFKVKGWPAQVLSRGEVVVENGKVLGQAGRGKLLKRNRFTEL
jgi:dihydropyrimidinase